MALRLQDKKNIVDEIAKVAADAVAAGVADYRGLTVFEMTELRSKSRDLGIYLKVVRNTLVRRAVEGSAFSCLQKAMVGSVFIMFSFNDPGAVARLLKDATKRYEKLTVCALSLGEKILPASDLDMIASLPTKDQAIAIFMLTLVAPVTKLARTTAETYTKVVRAIAAVGEQGKAT